MIRCALVALCLLPLVARAEWTSDLAEAAPSSSLEQLNQWLVETLVRAAPEPPVAVALDGPPALVDALSTLLFSRLTQAHLEPQRVSAQEGKGPAEAEARHREARSLLFLRLTLEGNRLSARGEFFSIWQNFWAGQQASRAPTPAALIALTTRADAQVLTLSQEPAVKVAMQIAPFVSAPQKWAELPVPLAALGTGDLDGDGKAEVFALTSHAVWLFAPTGALLARHDLEGGELSATPCREAFGTVDRVGTPARIAAFSCRYAQGTLLGWNPQQSTLVPQGTLAQPLLKSAGPLSFVPGQSRLQTASGGGASSGGGPFVSISTSGAAKLWVHPLGQATFVAKEGAAPRLLEGVGEGSLLLDGVGDGTLELLSTSGAVEPTPERLQLFRLEAERRVLRWEGTLGAGRARQLAWVDLEGDSRPELLVGLHLPDGRTEIQMWRQARP